MRWQDSVITLLLCEPEEGWGKGQGTGNRADRERLEQSGAVGYKGTSFFNTLDVSLRASGP